MKDKINSEIRIMDAGCGPSRLGLEFSLIFENSHIDLYDFSILNLFLANKIIS